jgi:rhodanese-related sulfurtransferase
MSAKPDPTTARSLADRLDEVHVVDVREQSEWDAGHIEGSAHIPLAELMGGHVEGLPTDRPIVAVCSVGQRSQVAALLLQARGHEAYNLDQGLEAWVAEGNPLTTPDGAPGRVA